MHIRQQVGAESLGVLAKALTTIVLLLRPDCRHLGLHIFSIAQLAYALVKTATFYAYFARIVINSKKLSDKTKQDSMASEALPADFPFRTLRDFLPSSTLSEESSHPSPSFVPMADPELTSLSWTFFKQTVVKQVLTEGERYVMTFFDSLSFADQGVYDIVNNLGSLVVRFLFQPIEESGNVFFSRTLKRGGGGGAGTAGGNEEERLASSVFRHLLRLVLHLGLLALVFGKY